METRDTLKTANAELGTSYADFLDWGTVSRLQLLTEPLLREFADRVDWEEASLSQVLTESLIRDFADRLDWCYATQAQELTEDLIRDFADSIDWEVASRRQALSESLLREFADRVDWKAASTYQTLPESIVRDFADRLDWRCVSAHQELSESIVRDFADRVRPSDTWLYRDAAFKRGAVEGTGRYDCRGDHFIAYKGVGDDRRGWFDRRIPYVAGTTLSARCDCTPAERSFGLSVWDSRGASGYGEAVRVRVRYEDVGRVLADGTVRCSRVEVLD